MDLQRLEQAYRYCRWITDRHYENFPVASWLIPKEKRPYIAAIYAFARSADDFADETRYQGRSLELLNAWKAALWASTSAEPQATCTTDGVPTSHPIFIALADAIHRCRLPVELLDDLLTAFKMDVTKKRYANWEELLTYCRYSANPVGRLVLTVFGIQDPQLHGWSDRICTGLQLANHWQDLSVDLRKDLLYIPQDLLNRYGVTVEELKQMQKGRDPRGSRPNGSRPFKALMEELVKRARALFDQGEPLLNRLTGRLRLELKLTVSGGRAILDRIEASGDEVFHHRPKLSSWEKLRLLTHALVSR